jgi:hypothetical protein
MHGGEQWKKTFGVFGEECKHTATDISEVGEGEAFVVPELEWCLSID